MQYLEGLQVMILGMGLVFFSLVTIMLVMMGLDRAFRNKPPVESEVEAHVVPPPVEAVAPPTGGEAEVALAIALAVARARGQAAAGAAAGDAPWVIPSGETAARQWEWLWDAGVDDYGTAKGSLHADVYDHR